MTISTEILVCFTRRQVWADRRFVRIACCVAYLQLRQFNIGDADMQLSGATTIKVFTYASLLKFCACDWGFSHVLRAVLRLRWCQTFGQLHCTAAVPWPIEAGASIKRMLQLNQNKVLLSRFTSRSLLLLISRRCSHRLLNVTTVVPFTRS